MTWMPFSHGFRLDPVAEERPEALVVVLHDAENPAAKLTPIAARWAQTVPTTAFITLEGIDPPSSGLPQHLLFDVDAGTAALDRATRYLAPLLEQQLRSCELGSSRLVLVGFGVGGTLALNLVLRQGWNCAGVLAVGAELTRPVPRLHSLDCKVRLIECTGDGRTGPSSLRDVVALLTARGMDTRGVSLAGSGFSDEAIRHGGAYLVELVATAQRRDRYVPNSEGGHA
jgi:predicted esterase